jgi:hypothetical protein
MQSIDLFERGEGLEPFHPTSPVCDSELYSILVKKTLTKATHARVCKLKKLVHTLLNRPETPADELAAVLKCSPSGMKRYIRDLEALQVIEVARYIPYRQNASGRPVYRLGSNHERVKAIISWGAFSREKEPYAIPAIDFTDGPPAINRDLGNKPKKSDRIKTTHNRDPLVAALFGEARKLPKDCTVSVNKNTPVSADA